ncbi:unnamed protein product, partial [Lota lota]
AGVSYWSGAQGEMARRGAPDEGPQPAMFVPWWEPETLYLPVPLNEPRCQNESQPRSPPGDFPQLGEKKKPRC